MVRGRLYLESSRKLAGSALGAAGERLPNQLAGRVEPRCLA